MLCFPCSDYLSLAGNIKLSLIRHSLAEVRRWRFSFPSCFRFFFFVVVFIPLSLFVPETNEGSEAVWSDYILQGKLVQTGLNKTNPMLWFAIKKLAIKSECMSQLLPSLVILFYFSYCDRGLITQHCTLITGIKSNVEVKHF